MKAAILLVFLVPACPAGFLATAWPAGSRESTGAAAHVIVSKEAGRFGGWPANNGIWSWGNEIVVGFMWGHFKNTERGHAIDGEKPSVLRFARSLDGGQTWRVETPSFLDDQGGEKEPLEFPGGIAFTDPNFAMRVRMNGNGSAPSRIYYSTDRCKTWRGPFKLPMFEQKRIMARTDYLVDGPSSLTAFVTAAKQDGREGRVFTARTTDGGKTWAFVSWIGPEPTGFSIMPASVRLSGTKILSALRCKDGPLHWIEAWLSEDNGQSWRFLNRPAESTGGSQGNPASLTKLKDGRLALTYGYRSEPFGMRARLTSDEGRTWGREQVLRADGGCWDLGYPKSVERPDGKIVTVYYFNDRRDTERYIAATIWDPDSGR